jgi:uncharacterized protein (DUF885 family)
MPARSLESMTWQRREAVQCPAPVSGFEVIMKKAALSFVVLLCLSACGKPASEPEVAPAEPPATAAAEPSQTETERLNAWFEERFEEQLQMSPIRLTMLGRKDRYDEFDDMSEEAEDQRLEWRRKTVETMEREFDYAALTPDAQISYDIWKFQYEDAAANQAYRGNDYLFTQFFGPQAMLPTVMGNFHRVDEPSDMDAYIKRLDGAARALNQLIDRAQKYAENGVRPPRFAYEGVLQQSRAVITGAPFGDGADSAIWGDVNRKLGALVESGAITAEQADAYRESAREALIGDLKAAYERLIAWVEADFENTSEEPAGVSTLPNGEAYYDQLLATYTTTDLTANEIHELGLSEVQRLRGEMEAIKREVGFEGDLQEFFEFVRDDPQFYKLNTDEGRQAYIAEVEEKLAFINERLPDYFGVLPKAELVVKRVEPFREEDGGAQHYMRGTPDGSRPGIYYMHLSDMGAMPLPQLEVIAYHEGNPGHHMQNSIALELEDVPTFRSQGGFGAYGEGWGLYSELLALEMGAYEDPYSNFGRLSSEMWRALRLVVDTGLHSKGWTEQEAVDFMMQNSAEPLASVQSEVRRYLVMPGQATSYKVGMIKILELRARAEEALGDRFDIRAFHDTILTGGAMPLAVLERRVDHWIEETLAASGA